MKKLANEKEFQRLHERIGIYASLKQYRRALNLLDHYIEEPLPLFQDQGWVMEERRLAWLYRIDLLRECGRVTEALAWACLEAEINPDNVSAVALKARLKRDAYLMPHEAARTPKAKSLDTTRLGIWRGVAGMRRLKAMLERDVILPLIEPEIYAEYRLELPNGILLYGPPGCGKTFIARKLAEVVGFSFKEVTPGDLASPYVHGTQERIAALFAEAKKQTPCMLFFDELDAMVPNRGGESVGHHYSSEVNEFLVQLNNAGRNGILVVGATNLPDRIDPAVRRPGRLDKKFFVGPPDYEARVELLRLYMSDRPQEKIDWGRCAIELENYTCAEIELVVTEAARTALESRRPITHQDIVKAASENPPAHIAEVIDEMTTGETEPDTTTDDINFQCPHCGTKLAVANAGAGLEVPCPNCVQTVKIPPDQGKLFTNVPLLEPNLPPMPIITRGDVLKTSVTRVVGLPPIISIPAPQRHLPSQTHSEAATGSWRWLLVLPLAISVSIACQMLLALPLALLLGSNLLLKLIVAFVGGMTFVFAGAKMAPCHKRIVGVVLAISYGFMISVLALFLWIVVPNEQRFTSVIGLIWCTVFAWGGSFAGYGGLMQHEDNLSHTIRRQSQLGKAPSYAAPR